MQLGILQRQAGYDEPPHTHKHVSRIATTIYETLYVERGRVEFDLYSSQGKKVKTVALSAGDTILLMEGGHALRVTDAEPVCPRRPGHCLGGGLSVSRALPCGKFGKLLSPCPLAHRSPSIAHNVLLATLPL